MKINHNELLTYPNKADQIMFGEVEQAADMGAAAVGATIYSGSDESGRQIVEVAQAFALAHEMGMATVLWCYLRNSKFKTDKDYHVSADLTGQANHLGVTIQADIIKQKLPENNGGYKALNTGGSSYGKLDERIYSQLTSDHPIDLTRYQVVNCYMGRAGLINSGGASGKNDFGDAAVTAVINKRAGGMGLISGRKAFQRPMADGVKLLNLIQDVYSIRGSRSRRRLWLRLPAPGLVGSGLEPDDRLAGSTEGHQPRQECPTPPRLTPSSSARSSGCADSRSTTTSALTSGYSRASTPYTWAISPTPG